ADLHDLAPDAKIIEHRLGQPGVFFESLLVDRLSLRHLRLYQEFERRQYRLLFGFEVEGRLTFLFGTLSRHGRPRFRRDETYQPTAVPFSGGCTIWCLAEPGLAPAGQRGDDRCAAALGGI